MTRQIRWGLLIIVLMIGLVVAQQSNAMKQFAGSAVRIAGETNTIQQVDDNGAASVTLATALNALVDSIRAPAVTTGSNTQVSCGTSSATIKAANTLRVALSYLNSGATTVYVCHAATCTTSTGMPFAQNIGYRDENYTGAVSCITTSGSSTVGVLEVP